MVEDTNHIKWQPVVLILNKRLECPCGNLAVFIAGKVVENEINTLEDVDVLCQSCLATLQQEQQEI